MKIILLLLFVFSTAALAQDALVGKYSGLRWGGKGRANSTELQIVSVEGNKVKAKLVRAFGRGGNANCGAENLMEGTYNGKTLDLSTVKTADLVPGCETTLSLTVSGNKLTGTHGRNNRKIELSK